VLCLCNSLQYSVVKLVCAYTCCLANNHHMLVIYYLLYFCCVFSFVFCHLICLLFLYSGLILCLWSWAASSMDCLSHLQPAFCKWLIDWLIDWYWTTKLLNLIFFTILCNQINHTGFTLSTCCQRRQNWVPVVFGSLATESAHDVAF